VPYGRARRRASYLIEQLVSSRTATELATLGTSHQVAALADRSFAEATSLRDVMVRAVGRGEVLAMIVTTGLLGAALVQIVADSGGAGVAAGVLGVISGTAATRTGGFAFGSIVMAAPKVQRYRAFVARAGDLATQHVTHRVERVELDDVHVTYPGADHRALAGVSVRARLGEIIALVGVNGAGKTTAVNALLGTVDLDSGSVTIDDADASALPLERRLGCFGLLTQEYGRYELSVRDTVRLGTPEPVSDDQVWAALDAARVGDVVRAMPHGLDTQLGTQFDGVGLSGGQWQRLALARVHLRDAAVWVLDEPTSAIDAEAEQQIFAELQRQKATRIIIVVSHRAWTLKDMDHVYVFDHGRVVEEGRYSDLLAAGGRFAEIFAEQA
jgi:ATP-binding cassette subfamily B protein